jgi:hypothetical protein
MKLAILSRSPRCYSTARLKKAAVERGHDVRVLDTLKFSIDLERGSPHLHYRSKELRQFDALLPRVGASITYYGTALVRCSSEPAFPNLQQWHDKQLMIFAVVSSVYTNHSLFKKKKSLT